MDFFYKLYSWIVYWSISCGLAFNHFPAFLWQYSSNEYNVYLLQRSFNYKDKDLLSKSIRDKAIFFPTKNSIFLQQTVAEFQNTETMAFTCDVWCFTSLSLWREIMFEVSILEGWRRNHHGVQVLGEKNLFLSWGKGQHRWALDGVIAWFLLLSHWDSVGSGFKEVNSLKSKKPFKKSTPKIHFK